MPLVSSLKYVSRRTDVFQSLLFRRTTSRILFEQDLICIVLIRHVHRQVLDDFLQERAAFIARVLVRPSRHWEDQAHRHEVIRQRQMRCSGAEATAVPPAGRSL